MHILVSGASGLLGSALCPVLEAAGHVVIPLRRGPSAARPGEARWDPTAGRLDLGGIPLLDGVVHLAGEPIARRWSREVKRRIMDSRVQGTKALCHALTSRPSPPRTLVCASAIGYYGDGGDRWLDETSPPGEGFLADVTRAWEAAATPALDRGLRVVHLRLGIVLSTRGGALGKMLPAFRLGAGGRLGDGRQYMSWIAIDDAVRVVVSALTEENLRGPVNGVAPEPVTNAEFTATLGRALRRPTVWAIPRFAVSLLFGEMGRTALLGSARVRPERLRETGFAFRHPDLEGALRYLLEQNS